VSKRCRRCTLASLFSHTVDTRPHWRTGLRWCGGAAHAQPQLSTDVRKARQLVLDGEGGGLNMDFSTDKPDNYLFGHLIGNADSDALFTLDGEMSESTVDGLGMSTNVGSSHGAVAGLWVSGARSPPRSHSLSSVRTNPLPCFHCHAPPTYESPLPLLVRCRSAVVALLLVWCSAAPPFGPPHPASSGLRVVLPTHRFSLDAAAIWHHVLCTCADMRGMRFCLFLLAAFAFAFLLACITAGSGRRRRHGDTDQARRSRCRRVRRV
jgi:hypothetical protein